MNALDGWHVPGVDCGAGNHLGGKYNLRLVTNDDLTPHLRLRNLPDLLARAILLLEIIYIKHAILPSMLGSMALQQCLRLGIVEYRFWYLRKS